MPWIRLNLKWLVLLGAMSLGLGVWFLLREPRARGHTLDEWLKEGVQQREAGHEGNPAEVAAAIREIGPKAVPILLAKLQATDPGWKTNLSDLLNKQSLFSLEFTWAEEEQAAALYGFGVLGTKAESALPALEKMFWETSNTWAAGAALGRIGKAALPILRAGLTNADRNIRFSAYTSTAMSSALAVATLPDLRKMTNDLDEAMAANAVTRLMRFAGKEEATRVAMEALASNRLLLRRAALFKLAGTDIETNRIVPVLIRLLEDPDGRFRQSVTNVLKSLDPVAAAAAGINTHPPPMLDRDRRGRGPVGTKQSAAPRP